MSDAVLPGGKPFLVVGELVDNEVTDAREGESAVGRLEDGHGDEGDVGVRRLDVVRSSTSGGGAGGVGRTGSGRMVCV